MRIRLTALLLAAAILAATAAAGHADPQAGERLAQRWCASCHLLGARPARPVPQGPPSFAAIAHSGMTRAQLRTFLIKPHGKMPDLSLSRTEINDLIDYIDTYR